MNTIDTTIRKIPRREWLAARAKATELEIGISDVIARLLRAWLEGRVRI